MPTPSVAVVAYPNVSPFHLSVPCILFGDILPGEQLFSLTVCAAEDGPIPAAHGMSVAPGARLEALASADIELPVPVNTQDARINALLDFLRQNPGSAHTLDALASRTRMSRRTFTRNFQKATGMSVGDWLLAERMRRTQELLEVSAHPIERIAELVGFGTAAALRQQFKQAFGVTPAEWRRSFRMDDA